MKTLSVVAALLLSTIAVGCADPSAEGVAESESAVTDRGRPSAPSDGIAACAGKVTCTETFVLKTLLASELVLTDMFSGEEEMSLASEHFVSWMKAGNNTYSTFLIETKPIGPGKYTVHISLGNRDLGEDATESGCGFDFTIENNAIVEREVAAACAG